MSLFTSKTTLAASQPRNCQMQHKSTPQPKHQQDEKALERARVQEEIDAAIDEWFDSTKKLAINLGERYNKKPRYFLDIFFSLLEWSITKKRLIHTMHSTA